MSPERLDWIRRNSRVRLDREGRWSLDGRPVEHPRVQALFHRGVAIESATGLATLTVGSQWCYIEHLEDTAYFVTRVRILSDEAVELVLAGGRAAPLEPSSVSQRGDAELHVVLQNGHRARLLRDAVNGLVPLVDSQGGEYGLRLGGQFFPFRADSPGE